MAINFEHTVTTGALDHLGVIRVSGVDARSFLHAQLTQDVETLSDNETRLAGYCSAKGRLYAIFQIFAVGETVYLITQRELIEPVVKRLRMFVLRAKVVLEDISNELQIQGVVSKTALTTNQMVAADSAFRLGVLPAYIDGVAYPRELRLAATIEGDVSGAVWDWLEVKAAQPHIERATYEAFVPQMVNLDRIGGVNFKKGCYPGQEVVARSHYLGKLKRRMQLVQLSCDDAESARVVAMHMPAKTDVHSSLDASQPIGVVVTAAVSLLNHSTVDVLVEVSLPMLDGGALLSINGHEAVLQPLPYGLSD